VIRQALALGCFGASWRAGWGLVVSGIPSYPPTQYSYADSQSFSFGEVVVSPPTSLSHTFEFVNRSSKTMRLLDVKPSCGCSVWKAEQREFKPGEKGTVELDLRVNGSGPTSVFADLLWSTGQKSRVTLAAMAKVSRELRLSKTLLEEPAGVPCEFAATYIDQAGREPPALEWKADDAVSVKIGPWQRLGPAECGC